MVVVRLGFLPESASNFGITEGFYLLGLLCGVVFTEPITHTVLLFHMQSSLYVFYSNWIIKKKRKQAFLFIFIVISFPAL